MELIVLLFLAAFLSFLGHLVAVVQDSLHVGADKVRRLETPEASPPPSKRLPAPLMGAVESLREAPAVGC